VDWTREAEKGIEPGSFEDDASISRSRQPGSLDLIFWNIRRAKRGNVNFLPDPWKSVGGLVSVKKHYGFAIRPCFLAFHHISASLATFPQIQNGSEYPRSFREVNRRARGETACYKARTKLHARLFGACMLAGVGECEVVK
jgi:hypothetical protein